MTNYFCYAFSPAKPVNLLMINQAWYCMSILERRHPPWMAPRLISKIHCTATANSNVYSTLLEEIAISLGCKVEHFLPLVCATGHSGWVELSESNLSQRVEDELERVD